MRNSGFLRKATVAASMIAVGAMVLSGCGGGKAATEKEGGVEAFDKNAETEITFAGWSLSSSPEFNLLAEGFHEKYPNVTVKVKEYSADNYDKQMTVDLASGKNLPDVFPLKSMDSYYTYAKESGGLADISDIAKSFDSANLDSSAYEIDGKTYGLPFRTDLWVMYYNKDIFEKTGVDAPDGTWTWDDYIETAEELKEKLPEAGYGSDVYPTFSWNKQSFVQDFAGNQAVPDAKEAYLSTDHSYYKPYYERALKLQDEKLTIDFNTITSTKVTYQGQFGTQKVAMFPVGSWYPSTLISQQKSGEAEQFNWGMAPVPQNPDSSTNTQTDKPVTIAGSTGLAVSAYSKGQKAAAAREFIKWAVGEEGAALLAENGINPSYISDKVTEAYFSVDGMPNDDLSKQAMSDYDVKMSFQPIVDKASSKVKTLLGDAHSAIMTETSSIDDAIADADQKIKDSNVLQ